VASYGHPVTKNKKMRVWPMLTRAFATFYPQRDMRLTHLLLTALLTGLLASCSNCCGNNGPGTPLPQPKPSRDRSSGDRNRSNDNPGVMMLASNPGARHSVAAAS
jgi:hypothetical protein